MTTHHRYLDAKVANYKKIKTGFLAIQKRPDRHVRQDGTWFPLKSIDWNIPWHIVKSTMSDETIEALNNDLLRIECWGGRFILRKGKKWRKAIKDARKSWAKILLDKQSEGKILCVTGSKVWRFQSGNLVELIEDDGKYYVQAIGETSPRNYPMGASEIQNLSWLEEDSI